VAPETTPCEIAPPGEGVMPEFAPPDSHQKTLPEDKHQKPAPGVRFLIQNERLFSCKMNTCSHEYERSFS
jgi:hypothetical protein